MLWLRAKDAIFAILRHNINIAKRAVRVIRQKSGCDSANLPLDFTNALSRLQHKVSVMNILPVSVIVTVFNEQQQIERLLTSLANQSRSPDEVVICDGGSTDGTVEAIQRWLEHNPAQLPQLQVLIEPGANISRGRNLAIAAATSPIIAATDAGVTLTPTWLAELTAPWVNTDPIRTPDQAPLAVAGFFEADTCDAAGEPSLFITAMAATVLPQRSKIDPNKFLPSSRSVAFTKAAWQTAGGYPEWLDYCEDLLFDFAINAQRPAAPSAFVWAPDAVVYFRPRDSLRAFWTQYYRYARGDGKADLWRKRHLIRYVTYGVLLPALLGHAFWGFFARWLGWAGLLLGVALYCVQPWQRLQQLGRGLTTLQWLQAALLVSVIRVVGDVAKMVGYPVGLWWRRRHWQRSEIHWRKKTEDQKTENRRPEDSA
jgi:glycosyltransferase involved in cell wall biosynthesis